MFIICFEVAREKYNAHLNIVAVYCLGSFVRQTTDDRLFISGRPIILKSNIDSLLFNKTSKLTRYE